MSKTPLLFFLLLPLTLCSPFTACNYRGNLGSSGQCDCFPPFIGEKCEFVEPPSPSVLLSAGAPTATLSPPSYKNLGPKNCKIDVGCTYDINWDIGFASTTYYGAGCRSPGSSEFNTAATTGKCGTACRKAPKAQYTAAIPLAYWPPTNYGNCPFCGFDCKWDGDVLLNSKPLCWKLTPYQASASGLPSVQGKGTPVIIHVTDSCGGNCPPGNPLTKGTCEGAASPDCGNTAMFERNTAQDRIPYKVYVGDHLDKPDPAADGYRCLNAWECNIFGTKYWSPCSHGGYNVAAPGFLDWCSGSHMHIDINTEAEISPLLSLCQGVSFPGNEASCMVKYEKVDCGPLPPRASLFAQGYSHWDQVNQRNVYCCQQQSWGTFNSCDGTRGNYPLCSSTNSGDCWQATC